LTSFSKGDGERVFVALGSNLGDSRGILEGAMHDLDRMFEGFRCSGLYRSAPLYVEEQPPFLNAVASGYWRGTAIALLDMLQSLEAKFGRDRRAERRHGPRYLDLDLLLFGRQAFKEQRLEVPHPRMSERRFVLAPLVELAPELQDPRTGIAYSRILPRVVGQTMERIEECPCEGCGEALTAAAGGRA